MKNYGLLTLYYYNIYMPFLHPLAGARGWSRVRASAAIAVFCTLACHDKHEYRHTHKGIN